VKINWVRGVVGALFALAIAGGFSGCGGDGGGGGLVNENPGDNDLNVVAAFGDSLTEGVEGVIPYPPRLFGLIGKTVHNEGIGGSKALENVDRAQEVIGRHHPAYMLILYGYNDIINGRRTSTVVGAIEEMVIICEQNNVVPVVATYPIPILGHQIFAYSVTVLNDDIRAMADARGIECVDLEAEFSSGETNPDNPDWDIPDPALYMSDGLHPSDAGAQVMAAAFADLF
jgi:lysophospholipase L1-like esterase